MSRRVGKDVNVVCVVDTWSTASPGLSQTEAGWGCTPVVQSNHGTQDRPAITPHLLFSIYLHPVSEGPSAYSPHPSKTGFCWGPPTQDTVRCCRMHILEMARWYSLSRCNMLPWQWLSPECVLMAGLSWVPWLLCTTGVQPHPARVQSVWLRPGCKPAINNTHSTFNLQKCPPLYHLCGCFHFIIVISNFS